MDASPKIKIKKEILCLLFIVLLVLIFIWQPLIVLFFPGLLIVYIDYFRKKGLPSLVVFILATSLSFWIVSFWALKILPIDLTLFARVIALISVLALIFGWKKLKDVELPIFDILIVLIFVLVLYLRVLPFFFQEAPAGADMSMNCYMARLIIENNGVPASHRPILPIDTFGSYPAGFHTITALISLLSNLPVQKSGLLVTGLTHSLISFGLFIVLTRYFSPGLSIAVSLISSFVVRAPQNYIGWGGSPTILSLFFVIMSFYLLSELLEKRQPLEILIFSFIFVAMPLTHPTPFAAFLYVFIVLSIYYYVVNQKNKIGINIALKNYFISLILCIILFVPYFASIKTIISASEIKDMYYWQQHEPDSFHAAPIALPWKLPLYAAHMTSEPLASLSLAGLIVLFLRKRREWIKYLLTMLVLSLLIANSNYWFFPLSFALNPERVALLFIIPFSIFSGFLFIEIKKWNFRLFMILLTFLFSLGIAMYLKSYLIKSINQCSVMNADIKAMEWLSKNTAIDDIIENNIGDAGLWIPAVAFRPIKNPVVNLVYSDELKEGFKNLRSSYAYAGAKKVYEIQFSSRDLDSNKNYKRIYSKNGASIYKIVSP